MTDYPDADTRADREAWSRLVLASMRYVLVMGEDVALTDPLTRFILWANEPEVILEVMGEALRMIDQNDSDDLLGVVPDDRSVQARFLPPEGNSNGSGGVLLAPITLGPDDECDCDVCTDSTWDQMAVAWGTCPCPGCQVLDPNDSSN